MSEETSVQVSDSLGCGVIVFALCFGIATCHGIDAYREIKKEEIKSEERIRTTKEKAEP